jgi:hypothetical protein
MRYRIFALLALLSSAAPAAYAQETALQNTNGEKPTLQQRLLPQSAATLLAPVELNEKKEAQPAPAANMAAPGSGTGLMIAGAALFVAGLIVGDDAGTLLAVTGAAIGAYGLYLYFR